MNQNDESSNNTVLIVTASVLGVGTISGLTVFAIKKKVCMKAAKTASKNTAKVAQEATTAKKV